MTPVASERRPDDVKTSLRQRLGWKDVHLASRKPREDPRLLATFAIYLYAAGGTVILVSYPLPSWPEQNDLGLLAVAGICYGAALFVLLAFDRLTRRTFEVAAALGTLLVTAAIYFRADATGAYLLFYFWVGLFSFSFFHRKSALLQFALIGLAYGAVLTVGRRHDVAALYWLMLVVSLGVTGMLVSLVTDRFERLWERERAQAKAVEKTLAERKRAEAAVSASEERFRTLVSNIPGAVYRCALDPEWTMEFVSDAIEEISGYPASDFIGNRVRSFASIVHPDDSGAQVVEDAVTAGASYALEYRIVHRDGHVRWVHDRGQAVGGADGRVRLDGAIFDITERRLAEAERERLLAAETAARAEAEAARRTLAEQNERLRELDRLKDEFVALVSHELRTPLTSIRGYVALLLTGRAGELADRQRRFLAVVDRNSDRLLHLVSDLLFFAQSGAGKVALELDAVDVQDLARQSVEAAKPLADQKGIALELLEAPLPPLAADRARLGQLLDNLLSNALKFTPEGGRVEVSARPANGHAVLSVADTGMGIPAEEQERLFERFFRSSAASAQAIPGTGLGLAIAKAIAEAHDGEISVESEEGQGTTFRVSLPIRPVSPDLVAAAS